MEGQQQLLVRLPMQDQVLIALEPMEPTLQVVSTSWVMKTTVLVSVILPPIVFTKVEDMEIQSQEDEQIS